MTRQADEHPEADVLGIDLSPIQSPYVPPNCRFEIDDAEDNWVYNYKFDYIHGRYICPFLADVPKMLERIYENLNPGGYVEIMETLMLMEAVDNSLDGHPLQRWASLMVGGEPARIRPNNYLPRDLGIPVYGRANNKKRRKVSGRWARIRFPPSTASGGW